MQQEGPDVIQMCPPIFYAGAGGGTLIEVEDKKGCRLNLLEMMRGNSCTEGAKMFDMTYSDYCEKIWSHLLKKNYGPPLAPLKNSGPPPLTL